VICLGSVLEQHNYCTARFTNFGDNKINAIKAVRTCTNWRLKESKDWVESMPINLTPKDGLTRTTLQSMVQKIKDCGGEAEMVIGTYCDSCELRFRCFTER